MKKLICFFLTLIMLVFAAGCMAEETNVGLSAPWNIYVHQLNAMFDPDPQIQVLYNEEAMEVKLLVEDSEKAEALSELLPEEQVFGNITLKVTVIPANEEVKDRAALFAKAFDGNPVLSYMKTFATPFGNQTYMVFQNKVVQYFSDNMQDINGFTSTLYQEIAKELFGVDGGLYFCTDLPAE